MYLLNLTDEGTEDWNLVPQIIPIYHKDGRLCVRVVFLYFLGKHNGPITGNDFQVDEREDVQTSRRRQAIRLSYWKEIKRGGGDEAGLHTCSMSQKSLLDKVWMDRSSSGLTESTNIRDQHDHTNCIVVFLSFYVSIFFSDSVFFVCILYVSGRFLTIISTFLFSW